MTTRKAGHECRESSAELPWVDMDASLEQVFAMQQFKKDYGQRKLLEIVLKHQRREEVFFKEQADRRLQRQKECQRKDRVGETSEAEQNRKRERHIRKHRLRVRRRRSQPTATPDMDALYAKQAQLLSELSRTADGRTRDESGSRSKEGSQTDDS